MSTFTIHASRQPRHHQLASSRIHHTGSIIPPSVRHGIRWRALPVEGSRAWLDSRKRSGALLGHLKGIFA